MVHLRVQPKKNTRNAEPTVINHKVARDFAWPISHHLGPQLPGLGSPKGHSNDHNCQVSAKSGEKKSQMPHLNNSNYVQSIRLKVYPGFPKQITMAASPTLNLTVFINNLYYLFIEGRRLKRRPSAAAHVVNAVP